LIADNEAWPLSFGSPPRSNGCNGSDHAFGKGTVSTESPLLSDADHSEPNRNVIMVRNVEMLSVGKTRTGRIAPKHRNSALAGNQRVN